MTLTNYFSAVVYESISPSQMQSEQQTLEHLLFPLPSIITTKFPPSLVVFENGHFQYRNKYSFSDKLFVAYSEDESIAAWRKWRTVMNERITAHYAKRDFKIPPLFADYFQLESVVPVFRPQDTSRGMAYQQKTRFPMYYELNFRISLPTLRPEPFDKAWQDFSTELAAEGKTDVIDFASVFVQNFLASDLRNLIKPFANGILQGEGMKVFMGINKNVIGLDYFHTRLNGKRHFSELYQPYDFPAAKDIAPLAQNDLMQASPQNNTNANARTSAPTTLAASAPITHTNAQAEMKLAAMVMKRTVNNLVAPLWVGLQGLAAACREAVKEAEIDNRKPENNKGISGLFIDANYLGGVNLDDLKNRIKAITGSSIFFKNNIYEKWEKKKQIVVDTPYEIPIVPFNGAYYKAKKIEFMSDTPKSGVSPYGILLTDIIKNNSKAIVLRFEKLGEPHNKAGVLDYSNRCDNSSNRKAFAFDSRLMEKGNAGYKVSDLYFAHLLVHELTETNSLMNHDYKGAYEKRDHKAAWKKDIEAMNSLFKVAFDILRAYEVKPPYESLIFESDGKNSYGFILYQSHPTIIYSDDVLPIQQLNTLLDTLMILYIADKSTGNYEDVAFFYFPLGAITETAPNSNQYLINDKAEGILSYPANTTLPTRKI